MDWVLGDNYGKGFSMCLSGTLNWFQAKTSCESPSFQAVSELIEIYYSGRNIVRNFLQSIALNEILLVKSMQLKSNE